MNYLKTKYDKHTNDNEKRRRSIKEKEKAKLSQSQIIKEALSNSNLNTSSSKKIVFSDGDDDEEVQLKNINGKEKTVLFDDFNSEDEKFEIKEKVQFGSKKGFELLNLQSTYGNDERFKIDERFLDDKNDEFETEKKEDEPEKVETGKEKNKQLKILESVLGQSVTPPESEKKAKKRTYEMVRYDASNKEHEKYEIKTQPETAPPAKKIKERKEKRKSEKSNVELPQVSKEKFYKVSNEIKGFFKEKKEEEGQFSLLQTYGLNGINEDQESEEEREGKETESVDEYTTFVDSGFGGSKSELVRKENTEGGKQRVVDKGAVAKGIWKESFFFIPDDPRFKEGLAFINKKDSEEASEAAENYDKSRKILREILRLHVKKQLHKKDPFRNKVGGMNKKQLANSKLKNSKTNFNKRKLNQVTSVRKFS